MCYRPLPTQSERIKILKELREEEIVTPPDFDGGSPTAKYNIVKWLLNHDPNKRPSSKELLQSDSLPVPKACHKTEMLVLRTSPY